MRVPSSLLGSSAGASRLAAVLGMLAKQTTQGMTPDDFRAKAAMIRSGKLPNFGDFARDSAAYGDATNADFDRMNTNVLAALDAGLEDTWERTIAGTSFEAVELARKAAEEDDGSTDAPAAARVRTTKLNPDAAGVARMRKALAAVDGVDASDYRSLATMRMPTLLAAVAAGAITADVASEAIVEGIRLKGPAPKGAGTFEDAVVRITSGDFTAESLGFTADQVKAINVAAGIVPRGDLGGDANGLETHDSLGQPFNADHPLHPSQPVGRALVQLHKAIKGEKRGLHPALRANADISSKTLASIFPDAAG